MAQPGYSMRIGTYSRASRLHSARIPLVFRVHNTKSRRETVCAGGTTGCSPVETVSHNEAFRPNRWQFHAASSTRLRWRTCSCRLARSNAVSAISSNRAGNTSNGYRVTHARAAASLAARRNRLAICDPQHPSSRFTSNFTLSRSSSASCLARKGPVGIGFTSNRVSGPNSVGTRLYFVFMFLPFFNAARPGGPVQQKTRD